MATRLYEHPIFLEHITPEGHPERPDRLRDLSSQRPDHARATARWVSGML